MNLPAKQQWLLKQALQPTLAESLKLYGTTEVPGSANNPVIMAWAKEVGVSGWYPDDKTAWCGLAEGVANKRAGFPYNSMLLSALAWAKWGVHVDDDKAMLGDTLVFARTGGGHVGKYIGESADKFLVFGGNQADTTGFEWVAKNRLFAVRRAAYKNGVCPVALRKVMLDDSGAVLGGSEA